MPENLREAIKHLQELSSLVSTGLWKNKEYKTAITKIPHLEKRLIALQFAISKLELLEKVGEVMPKKKEINQYDYENACAEEGYNQAIDDCTTIIAKKLEELENLEKEGIRVKIAEILECVEIGGDIGLATSHIIDLIRQHILGEQPNAGKAMDC